jgi:putative serine/threonine protein kinase
LARLYQQNVSFSTELDIRSPRLIPLITYPKYSESEYKDRIAEMESLGISSIILGGKTIVNGTPVVGKGCVGIVVKAKVRSNTKICALKIRRIDADRNNMNEESRFHRIANGVGVGPHFEGQTKNLIAMEYVPGQNIIDWVADSSRSDMRSVARDILEQCFRLDMAGLDHGELSRLSRHVIVSDRSYIIDFESASTKRKTSNVTAAAQSIFLYGLVANRVKRILGDDDTHSEKIINTLRRYKQAQTRDNFETVLDTLSLT